MKKRVFKVLLLPGRTVREVTYVGAYARNVGLIQDGPLLLLSY